MRDEGTAGARLEELLEALRRALVSELHDRHEFPGAVRYRERRMPRVVRRDPHRDIRRRLDILSIRIGETVDYIHKPFNVLRHAGIRCKGRALLVTRETSVTSLRKAIRATCPASEFAVLPT